MGFESSENWSDNNCAEELGLLLQQVINNKESKEKNIPLPCKISGTMFIQLKDMEGDQNFVAKKHKAKFWEDFVTGPYGMTLKWIDKNGKVLKTPVPFKDWESVSREWAEKNARYFYDKKAKEVSDFFTVNWLIYNQNQLDSIVSILSNVTAKSAWRLKEFLLSNRKTWLNEIYNYISNFAVKSKNWKKQRGLEARRLFEANWFSGVINSIGYYQNLLFGGKSKKK